MKCVLPVTILMYAHLLSGPLAAQQCPDGRAVTGDVGIVALHCTGPAASCEINIQRSGDDRARHVFAVEPIITEFASVGDLRVGDAVVAVDSLLITTAAGGARLARLDAGAPVRLLVRRDAVLHEVRITARRGCGIRSLRVSR